MAFHQSNRLFTQWELHCIGNHPSFIEVQTPFTSRESQIAWFSTPKSDFEVQLIRDTDSFVLAQSDGDGDGNTIATFDTIEAALAAI